MAVGQRRNEAFEALKNQLTNASMMASYDRETPTDVVTDACPVGIRGILLQEKQGVKRPVELIQPHGKGGYSSRLGLREISSISNGATFI